MKLISFNVSIKMFNNERVLEFLREQGPDIVLLQEAVRAVERQVIRKYVSAGFLVGELEMPHVNFAPMWQSNAITVTNPAVANLERDFGGIVQQGQLCLSKYLIECARNQFYYNSDGGKGAYKVGFDATNFKERDWVRSIQNMVVDMDGRRVQIINVHGIWNESRLGDARTIAQSQFILDNIDPNLPIILAGDFNLLPHSESIKMLEAAGLENLCTRFGIAATRPALDDGLDVGGAVVDYIFTRGIKVESLTANKTEISDHYPLCMEFTV